MKFKIYNYNGKATEVDTGDKLVKQLFVQVLSGDEVVTVEYDDGTKKTFDSSYNRYVSHIEESYIVEKDRIQDWVSYVPTDYDKQPWHIHYKNNTYGVPFKRACEFDKLFDKEVE